MLINGQTLKQSWLSSGFLVFYFCYFCRCCPWRFVVVVVVVVVFIALCCCCGNVATFHSLPQISHHLSKGRTNSAGRTDTTDLRCAQSKEKEDLALRVGYKNQSVNAV
jgi:hypothetical protein